MVSDHGYDELAKDDILVQEVLDSVFEAIGGEYVAKVDVELVDTDSGWSPDSRR